jgi:hypothetical protein
MIPGGGIKRVVYKPLRIEVFFMFNWLFGKKLCPKVMRLMAKKLKMDQLFHMRPWSSMDVEVDFSESPAGIEGRGFFISLMY